VAADMPAGALLPCPALRAEKVGVRGCLGTVSTRGEPPPQEDRILLISGTVRFPANRENNRDFFEFWPFSTPFGKASADSLGNSNTLRQIACSIRNPDFLRPNRELIHRNRDFTAIALSVVRPFHDPGSAGFWNRILMSEY
jgi:hypothetical protein